MNNLLTAAVKNRGVLKNTTTRVLRSSKLLKNKQQYATFAVNRVLRKDDDKKDDKSLEETEEDKIQKEQQEKEIEEIEEAMMQESDIVEDEQDQEADQENEQDQEQEEQEEQPEAEKPVAAVVPETPAVDVSSTPTVARQAPRKPADDKLNLFSIPTPPTVDIIPLLKRPLFPGVIVPIIISDPGIINALKNSQNKLFGLFLVKEEVRNKESYSGISDIRQLEPVGTLGMVMRVHANAYGITVVFVTLRRIVITGAVNTVVPHKAEEPAGQQAQQQQQQQQQQTKTTQQAGQEEGATSTPPKGDVAGTKDGDILSARISDLKDIPAQNKLFADAYHQEILACLRELAQMNPYAKEQINLFLEQIDVGKHTDITDIIPVMVSADATKLQELLSTAKVEDRLRKTLEVLKAEVETIRIQEKIHKDLESKISQNQRKFYLNEQLKLIKKELGLEQDEKENLKKRYEERLKGKQLPEAVDKVITEELAKLSTLETASSEFNVCRNYLDWLTILPWGVFKEETFDIKNAQKILDEDHYGLKKLKERILEFIAVGKLKGSVVGKIICFVGPPGVGKTSIGKSIAKALNREFYRFSVGGMSDVAEIKGHRRTYIGAMPGKLIQVLKLSKSANPVIMIDEIDKLGKGHGDPASALLEVLDPEQNNAFVDHYLDVPVDLSKVLFICTANMLDTIPRPLLDRMEVLRLSGYITEEKVNIAKKHLIPKTSEDTGINAKNVKMDDVTLAKLIREYCREAGVRSFQQHIEKVFRKVAFKIANGDVKPKDIVTVNERNLYDYLGKPKYTSDRYYISTPVGVTMGLAWTEMGGSTLYIETTVEPMPSNRPAAAPQKASNKTSKSAAVRRMDDPEQPDHANKESTSEEIRYPSGNSGGLRCTGKLGDVMKESALIAYTVAKKILFNKQPNNDFFNNNYIHMHVPEGATPKDGPSAGITMTTSLLSLATGRPVKHNLAMTGEITLTGKVLEIGGLKEKTIAARRSGVEEIIFPKENRKDWDELDEEIRAGLKVHFVDYFDEVFEVALNYNQQENNRRIAAEEKKQHEHEVEEEEAAKKFQQEKKSAKKTPTKASTQDVEQTPAKAKPAAKATKDTKDTKPAAKPATAAKIAQPAKGSKKEIELPPAKTTAPKASKGAVSPKTPEKPEKPEKAPKKPTKKQ